MVGKPVITVETQCKLKGRRLLIQERERQRQRQREREREESETDRHRERGFFDGNLYNR